MNDLYKLMIYNIHKQITSQDINKPTKNDFDIFEVTSVIGIAVSKPKEVVMMDYLKYCKSIKN